MTPEESDLIRTLSDAVISCCEHLGLYEMKADVMDAWRTAFWKKRP